MVELRSIKTSQFLVLLLQITVAPGQHTSWFTVGVGDEVTLPCENVTDNVDKCGGISWVFSRSGFTAAQLVKLGQIDEKDKSKSDRLSVSSNCSLVIKNVTSQDFGRYICRQFKSGQQQGPDSQVYLSVVVTTEREDNGTVILSCFVSRYAGCRHTVEWLYEGDSNDSTSTETLQHPCSATVKFMASNFNHTSKHLELWKCVVTEISVQVQHCNLSSCGTPEWRNRTSSAKDEPGTASLENLFRFVIVSAGLAALMITVVAVNMRTGSKGNQTQMEENIVHNDEDDDAVIYENIGELSF